MVALTFLVSALLFLPSWASPVAFQSLEFPATTQHHGGLLCNIPFVNHFLCPPAGSSALNVNTILGRALGLDTGLGSHRFSVRYATAKRWAPSTVATTWNPPNGSTNITALPLACPQPDVDPSTVSEDCLSMVIYVPTSFNPYIGGTPTLLWIHGGSFIAGSASDPGLDGSKLAAATNSIVAVVQYRLGALGFMAPDGSTNLAVQDVVNAMKFLARVLPSFGGHPSRITLAGQSSGGTMIRALLATPSASSLFQSAILQSDPMNYGFLSVATQQKLQANFNSLINCGATDTACWNALSLDTIINQQMNLFGNAVNIDMSTGQGEPIRPVRDGSLITSPLDSTAPFPAVNKPVLVSTVLNEAGPTIYGAFTDPVPEDSFSAIVQATMGSTRTATLMASNYYPPVSSSNGSVDARVQLEKLGTDYMWKCPSWTFARNWVQHGGTAYVGLYIVGATYPDNDGFPFCTQAGSVCHEDDIEIVFGTVPNPTSAQSALTAEMQKRYKAFLANGNPNAAQLPSWSLATTTNVHPLLLGGSGEAAVGACDPSFWGQAVQYDYQVYGI